MTKIVNSKQIPKFWWENTIRKIDTKLKETDITEKNLVGSLKLIGNGKISTFQGRVQYDDSDFHGYHLHVSGEIDKVYHQHINGEVEEKSFRYDVRISGYRNQWVEGEDLTQYQIKSLYTISALIRLFEKKFISDF